MHAQPSDVVAAANKALTDSEKREAEVPEADWVVPQLRPKFRKGANSCRRRRRIPEAHVNEIRRRREREGV